MIMMGRKRNGGMMAAIAEKIGKSENDFDSLKEKNAERFEPKESDDVEKEFKSGLDAAASKIIEALESKDASSLKESLRSFIDMAMKSR